MRPYLKREKGVKAGDEQMKDLTLRPSPRPSARNNTVRILATKTVAC